MKRILIISWALYPNIGGVEKYIYNLINLFNDKGFIIDVYITNYTDLGTREKYKEYYPNINLIFGNNNNSSENRISRNKFLNAFNYYLNIIKIKFAFNKSFKNADYDLIIDNTVCNFSKLRKNKKAVLIIHMNFLEIINQNLKNIKIYNLNEVLNFIIFKKIAKVSFSWKYYSNIVLFSEKDKYLLDNSNEFKKWQNIFYCYCSIKDYKSNFEYNISGSIISILRFENAQKNLTFLDEVSKELDSKIHVYGDGDDKILFKNVIIHNKITDENEKYKLLSKSSLFIMTSNSEGLPFSIVEALSVGLPIIIRDTFLHAKTLVKDNYNGLVFDKNATPIEVANGIKELLKKPNLLKEMSKNSIKIFQENFEISNFNKSWNFISEKIMSK